MTKQIATSSESGASGWCFFFLISGYINLYNSFHLFPASVNSEHGIESFERLLTGFQSQLAEFRNEDSGEYVYCNLTILIFHTLFFFS